jgi:uncharacterized protein (DUF1330 family)
MARIAHAVLEFDSVEPARGWYRSRGYQDVIGRRRTSAETNAAIVGGFEMTSG